LPSIEVVEFLNLNEKLEASHDFAARPICAKKQTIH